MALPNIIISRSTAALARSSRQGESLFETPPLQPFWKTQKSPPFIPGGMLSFCSTPREGSLEPSPPAVFMPGGAATLGQLSPYVTCRPVIT